MFTSGRLLCQRWLTATYVLNSEKQAKDRLPSGEPVQPTNIQTWAGGCLFAEQDSQSDCVSPLPPDHRVYSKDAFFSQNPLAVERLEAISHYNILHMNTNGKGPSAERRIGLAEGTHSMAELLPHRLQADLQPQ
jgi:hypothetical protein